MDTISPNPVYFQDAVMAFQLLLSVAAIVVRDRTTWYHPMDFKKPSVFSTQEQLKAQGL